MEKMSINKFCTLLKKQMPNIVVKTNKTFKDLTSFKIGGKIKCLIEITTINSLMQVFSLLIKYLLCYNVC